MKLPYTIHAASALSALVQIGAEAERPNWDYWQIRLDARAVRADIISLQALFERLDEAGWEDTPEAALERRDAIARAWLEEQIEAEWQVLPLFDLIPTRAEHDLLWSRAVVLRGTK